jgi:hypothetical protein
MLTVCHCLWIIIHGLCQKLVFPQRVRGSWRDFAWWVVPVYKGQGPVRCTDGMGRSPPSVHRTGSSDPKCVRIVPTLRTFALSPAMLVYKQTRDDIPTPFSK